MHINGANFWVARKRYKTEGSMVLLVLFSTMGLPGPLRNNATPQKFVPFTCNPEVRKKRLHINNANFWVARTRYKTEGSMALLVLFSTMGLPGPLRNNATPHKFVPFTCKPDVRKT